MGRRIAGEFIRVSLSRICRRGQAPRHAERAEFGLRAAEVASRGEVLRTSGNCVHGQAFRVGADDALASWASHSDATLRQG